VGINLPHSKIRLIILKWCAFVEKKKPAKDESGTRNAE